MRRSAGERLLSVDPPPSEMDLDTDLSLFGEFDLECSLLLVVFSRLLLTTGDLECRDMDLDFDRLVRLGDLDLM